MPDNSNLTLSFFWVDDAAFPLGVDLMHPYPGKSYFARRLNFKFRLSRAMQVIQLQMP